MPGVLAENLMNLSDLVNFSPVFPENG